MISKTSTKTTSSLFMLLGYDITKKEIRYRCKITKECEAGKYMFLSIKCSGRHFCGFTDEIFKKKLYNVHFAMCITSRACR